MTKAVKKQKTHGDGAYNTILEHECEAKRTPRGMVVHLTLTYEGSVARYADITKMLMDDLKEIGACAIKPV